MKRVNAEDLFQDAEFTASSANWLKQEMRFARITLPVEPVQISHGGETHQLTEADLAVLRRVKNHLEISVYGGSLLVEVFGKLPHQMKSGRVRDSARWLETFFAYAKDWAAEDFYARKFEFENE